MSFFSSVRGRLVATSTLAAALVAIVAALLIPQLVDRTLRDDAFDAAAEDAALRLDNSLSLAEVFDIGEAIGIPALPGLDEITAGDLGNLDFDEFGEFGLDLGELGLDDFDLGDLDLGALGLDDIPIDELGEFALPDISFDVPLIDMIDPSSVTFDIPFGEPNFAEIQTSLNQALRLAEAAAGNDLFDKVENLSGGTDLVLALGGGVVADIEDRSVVSARSADLAEIEQPIVDMASVFETVSVVEAFPTERRVPGAIPDVALRNIDGVDYIVGTPTTAIDTSVQQVRTTVWILAPLFVLAAGLVAWVLASRALKPVRAITDQTATISGGTLHERIPVPATKDEVAELANTMNGMLARLQSSDEQRHRFVSDASHELRSPIASMRSAAEVARRTPDAASVTELADDVIVESDRLGTIVADLLTLAAHDEQLPPARSDVDLDEVVLAEVAHARSVPVDASGVSAGRVRGRSDELARVVQHLLDNAARHATTSVAIAVRTAGPNVVLTVDDDGAGVPLDQRDRIFERFVRLDEARTRDSGGAGLGLAVVRSTVATCGGTIDVGESPLGGARFTVTLPVAP